MFSCAQTVITRTTQAEQMIDNKKPKIPFRVLPCNFIAVFVSNLTIIMSEIDFLSSRTILGSTHLH